MSVKPELLKQIRAAVVFSPECWNDRWCGCSQKALSMHYEICDSKEHDAERDEIPVETTTEAECDAVAPLCASLKWFLHS